MALDPLNTPTNLRDALSIQTYMALFDDMGLGDVATVDASGAVEQVLQMAHIRCVSWLGANYSKLPASTDTDVSVLFKFAELQYAIAMSFDRHPEYVRQYGETPRKNSALAQAELTMQRVQEAILKPVDSPSMGEPKNIGGRVVDSGQRIMLGSTNGALNSGDF